MESGQGQEPELELDIPYPHWICKQGNEIISAGIRCKAGACQVKASQKIREDTMRNWVEKLGMAAALPAITTLAFATFTFTALAADFALACTRQH